MASATVGAPHERVEFSYGDAKSHNCETLMLHPITGDAYLVIKAGGASVPVFRIDANMVVPAIPAIANKVADVALGGEVATGGDIHPCGDRLLLRTHGGVRALRANGAFETAFASAPKTLAIPPNEVQGEAIAYLTNGKGYVTGSEAKPPFPLHVARCE